jgi:O-methyltransferase
MKYINTIKTFIKALQTGQEYARFVLCEAFTNIVYQPYKFSEFGRNWLLDKTFLDYYEAMVGTDNYHSLDRKYTLDQLMQLVVPIDGDTAECGGYKGASSFLICRRIEQTGKTHHVFDSFEGLSLPEKEDGTYWKKGDLNVSEHTIKRNLKRFEFVVYHKGWIPDRFHEVAHNRFCFVHLDVDLYQPTLDSLNFFYQRMASGGIILCDDYGFVSCPGTKSAMDQFFADHPEKIISLTTGQGLVIKQ